MPPRASFSSGTVAVDGNVPVPMPDGVRLATDIFRPAASGRHPVILVRTPYDKRVAAAMMAASGGVDALRLAREGYVVAFQDVRGAHASEGDPCLFRAEADDGAAAVAWAASQEWSNGEVAMAGGSYLGAAQLLAATLAPPALRAILPSWTTSDFHDGWVYQGGAFELGFSLSWASGLALAELIRRGEASGPDREVLQDVVDDCWAAYRRLPLLDFPRRIPTLSNYGEWLEHPDRDGYWRDISIRERYGSIDVPALHAGGWHDIFLKGTLENYVGLRAEAASERTRANQYLLLTPWGHGPVGEVIGEVWFGREAGVPLSADLASRTRAFIEAFLKGNGVLELPPVRIFVMGANRFRDEDEWPLRRAVGLRLYLRSGGRLTGEPPSTRESPGEFVYDPADPVPTMGGNTLLPGNLLLGPRDRRAVHERRDVLLYTSDVLQDDLEVTGPLTATLHVSSSATDTDFTVALADLYPDGRAMGIADGILRLRYRESFAEQRLATPGEVYEIEVDLVATSNVFKAGHRIAVEVSSSNFPRFDRNPNHGGVIAEATEKDFVVARQHVFQDVARPSFVTLPVVSA
jgi:putative CocE/NonD family hydrolase